MTLFCQSLMPSSNAWCFYVDKLDPQRKMIKVATCMTKLKRDQMFLNRRANLSYDTDARMHGKKMEIESKIIGSSSTRVKGNIGKQSKLLTRLEPNWKIEQTLLTRLDQFTFIKDLFFIVIFETLWTNLEYRSNSKRPDQIDLQILRFWVLVLKF